MRLSLCAVFGLCLVAFGCKSGAPPAPKATSFPELGTGTKIAEGVERFEVQVPTDGSPHRLWVYLPTGNRKDLPLVVIAPAGSPLIHGMALGDADAAEHVPYVQAGLAVVAYEISGPVSAQASDAELLAAMKAFRDAGGGLSDAKVALDYAFAKLPIDKKRVFSAGHSSAATLSLLVAAREPRITGCIAYAPATDIPKRLGQADLSTLDANISGFSSFITDISPSSNVDRLKCPVFIFQAQDDDNVPIGDTSQFVDTLKKTNAKVTFLKVPTGGHYDAMIGKGIAAAIEWVHGQ